jgi:hypothetical protein
MAADTPAPIIDAFFRFFSDSEFDDSRVVDTVHEITGRPSRSFEQWTRAHTRQFERRPDREGDVLTGAGCQGRQVWWS